MCYALYLFTGDNYYKATLSKAEWHVNAGEYGTNYPKDFKSLGIWLRKPTQAAGGMDELNYFGHYHRMSVKQLMIILKITKSYLKGMY